MSATYCHMFGLTGYIFRFGNVVGPRQTLGFGFDFVRMLAKNSDSLPILGDGSQSKSYIYVDNVISAVLHANENASDPFNAFNVATGAYITVSEIADLAVNVSGLKPGSVCYDYKGGDRG